MKPNRPKEEDLSRLRYEDGKLYWLNTSSPSTNVGDVAGYKNDDGYVRIRLGGKQCAAHRLVYLMHTGEWPVEVDHINGVRDDNRIENLRAATKVQSQRNVKLKSTNTSGVKNVSWNKKRGRWVVSIRFGGKINYFGMHESLEFAELVAIEAREKYHGEFANHG